MHPPKNIRSFVKRQRPFSPNKQKMFDKMWPEYGLDLTTEKISPEKIFGRNNKLTLEIGFGNGETLFSLAQKYPKQDFIGIEVYKPGIASLFTRLKKNPLSNIRIYNEDAVTVLEKSIPDQSLDKIIILFPDPWPKKRHHKRRLIQAKFIELLAKKIKPGGTLNIATDWENYAKHIVDILKNNDSFSRILLPADQKTKERGQTQKTGSDPFGHIKTKKRIQIQKTGSDPFGHIEENRKKDQTKKACNRIFLSGIESDHFLQERTITTKFEERGKKLGHDIFDLMFTIESKKTSSNY